jgi:hypothetical protein
MLQRIGFPGLNSLEQIMDPTTSSIVYNHSFDGVMSYGLDRTLTVGQTLVVGLDLAQDADAVPTRQGTPTPNEMVPQSSNNARGCASPMNPD